VKLRSVKAVLKEKNMVCFENLKQKVIQALENLSLAQNGFMDSFGSADNLLKERECLHAYVSIIRTNESFLKQKARKIRIIVSFIDLLRFKMLGILLTICGMNMGIKWMMLIRLRRWQWTFIRIC
jgi:hypothetical protein